MVCDTALDFRLTYLLTPGLRDTNNGELNMTEEKIWRLEERVSALEKSIENLKLIERKVMRAVNQVDELEDRIAEMKMQTTTYAVSSMTVDGIPVPRNYGIVARDE